MAIGWARVVAKEWVLIEEVRDSVNHRTVTSEGGGRS